ncbi:hypothetical protein [Bradyrhizobium genosp. P]|uniref:hypothetical protein n=1 Tax=Bradyrhizobium genosp. P TaxID=83641 RepID=UPI003CF90CA6
MELADEHFAEEQRKEAMGYTGLIKNCVVALAGVGFFFGIIGVFGLSVSLASLAAFIAVAIWIFNSKQLPDAGR